MIITRVIIVALLVWAGIAPVHAQVISASRPPQLNMTSPTVGFTYDAGINTSVAVNGTGTNLSGVCTWTNSLGGSGTASLALSGSTLTWNAGSVPLSVGENLITVTCGNGAGSFVVRGIYVTRIATVGTTYFVRTDGNDACNGLVNSAGSSGACAWQHIDYAASNITVGGDTVWVQPGTYNEVVSPTRNGSAGSPITFVGDFAGTDRIVCGATYSVNSYQRWIGFKFSGTAAMCGGTRRFRVVEIGGASHHLEFWHNTIGDGEDGMSMCCTENGHLTGADQVDDSIFIGNNYDGNHAGNLPSGGSSAFSGPHGDHIFVGYNEMQDWWADGFNPSGTYHYYMNQYVHDMLDGEVAGFPGGASPHSDVWQFSTNTTLGFSYILFESTFHKGMGAVGGTNCAGAEQGCNEHTTLNHLNQPERCNGGVSSGCDAIGNLLYRRNAITNVGSGIFGAGYTAPRLWTYMYHLNNTIYKASQAQTPGNGNAAHAWFSDDDVDYVAVRHDIEVEAWTAAITGGETRFVYALDVIHYDADRNLAFDEDFAEDSTTPQWGSQWTGQSNELTQKDPDFVDKANRDFTLQSTSPAIGAGSYVCLTVGGGTGTTATFDPGCGSWFRAPDPNLTQYGASSLVPGDTIMIGTDVVTITGISGDVITYTPSITHVDNDPVYPFGTSTQDLGAYPYKAGGYSLGSPTYTCAVGTCTATVSDPDLVRFAVCYVDGVPSTIDSSPPFACPDPVGTLTFRLFKRYASENPLWVDAAEM